MAINDPRLLDLEFEYALSAPYEVESEEGGDKVTLPQSAIFTIDQILTTRGDKGQVTTLDITTKEGVPLQVAAGNELARKIIPNQRGEDSKPTIDTFKDKYRARFDDTPEGLLEVFRNVLENSNFAVPDGIPTGPVEPHESTRSEKPSVIDGSFRNFNTRVVTTAPRQHPDHPETLLPAGTLLSLETVEALERRSRDGEEVSTTAHVWSIRGQEGMPHLRTAVPDGSLIKDRRELANLRFPAARFGRPLSFDRAQQLLTSFNFRPGTTPDEMIQLFQAAIKTIQTYHRDIEKRPRHGSSGH